MATEDILINDGDGFVSLSELAAEQVDVALPISSTDGTVTLDSPSANNFVIKTSSNDQVTVDQNGRLLLTSNSKYLGLDDLENYLQFNNSKYGDDTLQFRVANQEVLLLDGTENKRVKFGSYYEVYSTGNIKTDGQLQTNTITTKDAATNEASIALGTDVQIKVGDNGDYGLRVRPDGNVAVGGEGGGTSRLAVQGSMSGSQCYGVNNIIAFDDTVRSAISFTASASWSGDRQADDTLYLYTHAKLDDSVGSADRLFGFSLDITDGTTAAKVNRAFFTNLNAEDEKENFSFFAAGTAPSLFAGSVQTPRIVGSADPSSDASIELGANFTSNAQPPPSQTASPLVSSFLIKLLLRPYSFGSPSDDTTPDLPSGSTRQPVPYVKGTTNWKKSLYPLDSIVVAQSFQYHNGQNSGRFGAVQFRSGSSMHKTNLLFATAMFSKQSWYHQRLVSSCLEFQ